MGRTGEFDNTDDKVASLETARLPLRSPLVREPEEGDEECGPPVLEWWGPRSRMGDIRSLEEWCDRPAGSCDLERGSGSAVRPTEGLSFHLRRIVVLRCWERRVGARPRPAAFENVGYALPLTILKVVLRPRPPP